MMPGDMSRVAFTFDVEPPLADPEAKLELSIRDDDLRERRRPRSADPDRARARQPPRAGR